MIKGPMDTYNILYVSVTFLHNIIKIAAFARLFIIFVFYYHREDSSNTKAGGGGKGGIDPGQFSIF